MIQRIQSLYLLIVSALMVTLLFVPFATFTGSAEEFVITAWGIRSLSLPETEMIMPTIYVAVLIILAALVPLVAIFLYKRRFLQLRLCVVEVVLLAGVQIYIAMFVFKSGRLISGLENGSMRFSIVDIFPIIGIILIYLAFRGIMRDIALIKSLDRIR